MGRGKSWDLNENEALAHAWSATYLAAANALAAQAGSTVKLETKDGGTVTSTTVPVLPEGVVVEVGSRAFSRAVHARFSAVVPPPGTGPGRYAARSEQACKQHFADLAIEIRRYGSTAPRPDNAVYGAWQALHQHPYFTKPHPTSSRSPAPPRQSRTLAKPTPRIPAPTLDPGSATAGSDAGADDDDAEGEEEEEEEDEEGEDEDNEEITPAQPPQAPTPTVHTSQPRARTMQPSVRAPPGRIRRTRKRPRQEEFAPTSAPVTVLRAIDTALVSLAGAIRERAERQEEANGLLAFSHPTAIETEQGRREQMEYLTIMRRLCLHRARARAQQILRARVAAATAPTATSDQPAPPQAMNE